MKITNQQELDALIATADESNTIILKEVLEITFDCVIPCNIKAHNIKARNIKTRNIKARNIKARYIKARYIKARYIDAWNIDADYISEKIAGAKTNKMKSKVIQTNTTSSTQNEIIIIALCEDGSIWKMVLGTGDGWLCALQPYA